MVEDLIQLADTSKLWRKISFFLDSKLPQTSFFRFPELLTSHRGEKPVAILTLVIDVLLPGPHGVRRNPFASVLSEKKYL